MEKVIGKKLAIWSVRTDSGEEVRIIKEGKARALLDVCVV
jgi:hypothetical protein